MDTHGALLLSINIFSPESSSSDNESGSGINKRPIKGRVALLGNGVQGDRIFDKKNHGGYDAALYAYADEDTQWWQNQLGVKIPNGKFGENLTTQGVDVTGALIGEKWRIGSALLEVSQPRIPCLTFAEFWDRPTLIKDFTQAGRPGSYLRIIEEGEIEAGDKIVIEGRPSHGITIGDLFSAKSGERSRISEIAQVPQLSTEYREWALKIAESQR